MSFKVGQKVVCVRATDRMPGEIAPTVNEIYTIRELVDCEYGLGFLLEEIVNSPRLYADGFGECVFTSEAFRPIDYSFGEKVTEEIVKEVSPKETELIEVLTQ